MKTYNYIPAGWDIFDARTALEPYARVVKIQPHGCPRNGTMGHCFVARAESPRVMVGLVCESSLELERFDDAALGVDDALICDAY